MREPGNDLAFKVGENRVKRFAVERRCCGQCRAQVAGLCAREDAVPPRIGKEVVDPRRDARKALAERRIGHGTAGRSIGTMSAIWSI